MNSDSQTIEEYYESLIEKYPDVNHKIESLIKDQSKNTVFVFEMLFEYASVEEARTFTENLFHPFDDSSALIYPKEESGKFYSGFSFKKKELNRFQILTGYHAYLSIALENNGKLSLFKLTSS